MLYKVMPFYTIPLETIKNTHVEVKNMCILWFFWVVWYFTFHICDTIL